MSKIKLIFITLLITSVKLFAKDSEYLLKPDTKLYKYTSTDKDFIIETNKNKIFKIQYEYPYYIQPYKIELINEDYPYVHTDDIFPKDSDELIQDKYITKKSDDFIFIPTFYLDIIANNDRELIRKYMPELIKKYGEPNEMESGWYQYILLCTELEISNSRIDFSSGYGYLFIENINNIKNGFKIWTNHYYLENKKEIKSLKFLFDGDYLDVYADDNSTPLFSFFKIKKNDHTKLDKFIQQFTDNIDLKSFTWPTHADGSCDYDYIINQLKEKEIKNTNDIIDDYTLREEAINKEYANKPLPQMGDPDYLDFFKKYIPELYEEKCKEVQEYKARKLKEKLIIYIPCCIGALFIILLILKIIKKHK